MGVWSELVRRGSVVRREMRRSSEDIRVYVRVSLRNLFLDEG